MSVTVICQIPLVRAMLVSVCEAAGFVVSQSFDRAEDVGQLAECDFVLLHVFQDSDNVETALARLRSLSSFAPIALIAPDKMAERLQGEQGTKVSAIIPESFAALDLFASSLKMVSNGFRLMPGNGLTPHLGAHDPVRVAERGNTDDPMWDLLSKREIAILTRICDGKPNKTIATDLGICEGTVKVHLRTIFRKTGARNRTQAALWGTAHMLPGVIGDGRQ